LASNLHRAFLEQQSMRRWIASMWVFGSLAALGCAETVDPGPLRISEIVADNEGVWVDESGETEDWIELVNVSDERIWLDEYALSDRRTEMTLLPAIPLGPGERIVFFADDEIEEGERHLPFKLSAESETLYLRDREGDLRDLAAWSALAIDHAFARFPDGTGEMSICRYTSPTRDNGDSCLPSQRDPLEVEEFEPFSWPESFPPSDGPLTISEIALRPASFIELLNESEERITLSNYELRIAVQAPGEPAPAITDGVAIEWPTSELDRDQRVVLPITESDIAELLHTPSFEGVITLFERENGRVLTRVDFMEWPENTVLARTSASNGRLVFCDGETPGSSNDACIPIAEREMDGRLRNLRTPSDFEALAAGGTEVGLRAVKVVIDMEAGDVVHFLGSRKWDLHYTFVREVIEGEPHLDRCDPEQNALFTRGWYTFSDEQYQAIETRRYLLATLVEYATTGHRTIEFETGDRISPAQMERAFFAIASHVWSPRDWSIRPQSDEQTRKLRMIEGRVPIIGSTAPLRDLVLQPLSPGVGFGVLRWIPAQELADAPLGLDTIVVTDDVPGDLPLVGGLITETVQTPLSHINVLSRGRNTPNMTLRDARNDPRLAPYFDSLVRFEVEPGGFRIEPADLALAEAFWAERRPSGPRLVPRLDTSMRDLVPLDRAGLADLPSIGAKAAQLAELGRVVSTHPMCLGPIPVPRDAFAIPIVHSIEHFEASGARELLTELMNDPAFRADPRVRAEGLARVRQQILEHPIEPALLERVTNAVRDRFGNERARFRSSSNIEDLPHFNGAGLYTSVSAELDDPTRPIADAMRTVWASLWNQRAYDEREIANIDQTAAAMGILVHLTHLGEAANGVGVSRNIFDPTRGDMHYFNVQIGEASVVNPAPGVSTEEILYRFGRDPRIVRQSRSSLTSFDVLSDSELDRVACTLSAIHDAFRPMLDPEGEARWFAMDIEFKFNRDRELIVKQARPYSFGNIEIPADCREF
jgi:hypothetical protein